MNICRSKNIRHSILLALTIASGGVGAAESTGNEDFMSRKTSDLPTIQQYAVTQARQLQQQQLLPNEWLERIRQMVLVGEPEETSEALKLFSQDYPEYSEQEINEIIHSVEYKD
ncbi:MAG: hypothetical protein ABW168_02330 [Sedimenticola sp.]